LCQTKAPLALCGKRKSSFPTTRAAAAAAAAAAAMVVARVRSRRRRCRRRQALRLPRLFTSCLCIVREKTPPFSSRSILLFLRKLQVQAALGPHSFSLLFFASVARLFRQKNEKKRAKENVHLIRLYFSDRKLTLKARNSYEAIKMDSFTNFFP